MEDFSWFLGDLLVPIIFYAILFFAVSPRIVALISEAGEGTRKYFNLPQLALEGWNLNANQRSLLIRCMGCAFCLSPAFYRAFLEPWSWIVISVTWALSIAVFLLFRRRLRDDSD